MVHLEALQKEQEDYRRRMHSAFQKVIQIRKHETENQKWRREQAGLKWLDDYLLESDCTLRDCIYDGRELKKPGQEGAFNCINAGYRFGFEIPIGFGKINFSLYTMDLYETRTKDIYQCPKCKLVYSLPREIDVLKLLEQRKLRTAVYGIN